MTRIRRDLRRERWGRLMATSSSVVRKARGRTDPKSFCDILGYPALPNCRGAHDFFTNPSNFVPANMRPVAHEASGRLSEHAEWERVADKNSRIVTRFEEPRPGAR